MVLSARESFHKSGNGTSRLLQRVVDGSQRIRSGGGVLKGCCYLLWRGLRLASLHQATKEQGLVPMMAQLKEIVVDYSDQYSYAKIEGEFWNYKVRAQHAFQVRLACRAIERFVQHRKRGEITVADIGDSSGNHVRCFKALNSNCNIRSLSVNIDPIAVKKIREKGLDAVQAKAEELENYDIHPDILVCFQTLEHLHSPIEFLRSISGKSSCTYLVITVPYRFVSRVGLFHIRRNREETVSAERTHIFELSPADWKLIYQHAGWRVVEEEIYLQYPLRHPLRVLRSVWAAFDHEGFHGVVLAKDDRWSRRYLDW